MVDYNVSVNSEFVNEDNMAPFRTCKSDRNYEVGIVYLDREGRQTPVLIPRTSGTSRTNTALVPFSAGASRNRLEVELFHEAPYWATHYRFFIKQTKQAFYNLAPTNTVVDTTNNLVYLQIPSLEQGISFDEQTGRSSTLNKVTRNDILLLKSVENPSARDAVVERREYRVTEVGFIDADTNSLISEDGVYTVSYTHLTLPTILLV